MRRRWLIALGATIVFALPASAKDGQGVMLPDQPTQFIFAYGSLINSASRNSTAGNSGGQRAGSWIQTGKLVGSGSL